MNSMSDMPWKFIKLNTTYIYFSSSSSNSSPQISNVGKTSSPTKSLTTLATEDSSSTSRCSSSAASSPSTPPLPLISDERFLLGQDLEPPDNEGDSFPPDLDLIMSDNDSTDGEDEGQTGKNLKMLNPGISPHLCF